MSEHVSDLGDGKNDDPLYRLRHSLAHVMAQAVLDMRPGSTRGFGPPIDTGFYYDFVLSEPITAEDFPEIEKRMKRIIKGRQKFEREDLPIADALARLEEMREPYKVEYARELAEKNGLDTLSFYTNGPFVDMCEGPHVDVTSRLPKGAFKVRSVAGAYWRGDERNQMMTRLYTWAYTSKEELEEAVRRHDEALRRDHKKLGPALDIYHIDDEVGKGLPLWLPNGTAIRDELEKVAKEKEFRGGYQRVVTPHVTKANLYHLSGHLPYYEDVMYPPMVVEEQEGDEKVVKEKYYLKPMNCPHHHRIFAARKRSYRDLPIRLAEYGTVYRFEHHGALSGLLRVRGMSMNDAHIYCTEEQIHDEFLAVMQMHKEYFELLGITDYYMRLSLWDPEDPKGKQKYVDNPQAWERTEKLVREAMLEADLPFVEVKGEAAFYGPKVDIQITTVTGREETFSTNQLDFAVPQADRMNLTYVGADGAEHHPYIIHRAPLGTHERFVAYLIEHFGGAFPTWLAPVQVRIIPVSEKYLAYGDKLATALRNDLVRVELDSSDEKLGKKIREGTVRKIPILLVVGEQEQEAESVTVRRYGEKEQASMPFTQFSGELGEEIRSRVMRRKPGI
ncbi:MAG: threonine--tRNA ligase [Deltaproteobacteria bacterium]|nr:threonine--tRNA ligase [Deltaproteobacteria bacterium]